MRRSCFKTDAVYDHTSRALDELRRMNFVLVSLSVAMKGAGVAEVRIDYEPQGSLLAGTWFERLREMSGVFDCSDIFTEDVGTARAHKCRNFETPAI